MKKEVGGLENLYSGTSKSFSTQVVSLSHRSRQVTPYVTHKI
jgi:hypothetical protein